MDSLQITMMSFFLLLVTLSIFKLRYFLRVETLSDDDRTPESVLILYAYIKEVLDDNHELTRKELFERVCNLEQFDKEHFWRFNENRLNHLIDDYYIRYEIETLEALKERL